MSLVDAAGWAGGLLVLVAYVLLSVRRLASDGHAYQAMNVVGGLLLMCSAVQAHAFPNVVINVVWIVAGSLTLAARWHRGGPPAPAAASEGTDRAPAGETEPLAA